MLASEKFEEVFSSCRDVLKSLQEPIPDTPIDMRRMGEIVKQTGKLLERVPGHSFVTMKQMDKGNQFTVKLFSLMVCFQSSLTFRRMSFWLTLPASCQTYSSFLSGLGCFLASTRAAPLLNMSHDSLNFGTWNVCCYV